MTIQECYKEMGGEFRNALEVWRWWKNLPSSF